MASESEDRAKALELAVDFMRASGQTDDLAVVPLALRFFEFLHPPIPKDPDDAGQKTW